jgi:heme-degrading monooxygenase HmoA
MGMAKGHFIYTWEFTAAPGKVAEFQEAYGAEGAWVKLFRRAPGYLRSELFQDRASPERFITVDHWESEEAWRAFREKFCHEYEDLDVLCEQVTVKEREIGRFQSAG